MSIIYRLVFAPPAFFHIAFYGIDFSHNSYLITFEFHTVRLWRDQKESSSIIIHLLDPFDPSFNEVDVLVNYYVSVSHAKERLLVSRLLLMHTWPKSSKNVLSKNLNFLTDFILVYSRHFKYEIKCNIHKIYESKRSWTIFLCFGQMCKGCYYNCLYFKSNLAQRQLDPSTPPFTRNEKNIQNMVPYLHAHAHYIREACTLEWFQMKSHVFK